jgi:hypothetical protein
MPDQDTHSHSNQDGSPAPLAHERDDSYGGLYALADCEKVDLQNGGVLLIHRHNDSQMIVAETVSTALSSCRTFRTLQGHADHLAATIPQLAGQQADVLKVLQTVTDNGLMNRAESVCERLCPADTPPATDLPPTRIFIITCDRPAEVQRLLESMLHAGNLTHHEHLFLVDDSREPDNAAQNREAVARFNLTSPRDMYYVGAGEQKKLLDALIAELPGHEPGIRFLIDRERWADKKSYGLARNLCLLLSMGRRAIVMDDDVICAAVQSPHRREGVIFGDRQREVDFYASQEDILQRTARADFDPLTGHARCLGLTMAQAINKLGITTLQETQLQGASSACLDLWSADSPVLITQSGTIGDPGTPGTRWIYTLDPASTRRLLATPGGLNAALANRHYWMGQARPVFGKLAVMSQVTGLDNSRLLPPYFPVFRNEDDLFGAMVEFLHPHAAVLDYDWAVPHFPLEDRGSGVEKNSWDGNEKLRMGKLLADHTVYRSGISPQTRLKHLAMLVRSLGETSDRELMTLYRYEVADASASRANRLGATLQDGVARPEPWQDYLRQRLTQLNEALQIVPKLENISGVPGDYSEQAILGEFRDCATGFASGLQAWPALRQSAESVVNTMLVAGDLLPQ